jgi:magnesium transporter
MIYSFKIEEHKTIAVDKPASGTWVNVLPPLKQEEFSELSRELDIPLDFLKDSLDIDERSRYEVEDNVKFI